MSAVGVAVGLALSAPASAQPIAVSPAFTQGNTDRQSWETWYNGLSGEYQAGALFWSGQRSLPHPAPCQTQGGRDLGAWTAGCMAAQQRLALTDVRRKAEPDYRLGWNAWSATATIDYGQQTPSTLPPSAFSAPPPPAPPAMFDAPQTARADGQWFLLKWLDERCHPLEPGQTPEHFARAVKNKDISASFEHITSGEGYPITLLRTQMDGETILTLGFIQGRGNCHTLMDRISREGGF